MADNQNLQQGTAGHEDEVLTVATAKRMLQKYKSQFDTIPELQAAPDETVLTYTHNDKTFSFHIGDEARVHDTENGDEELGYYVFYKLYDIVTENGTTRAVWGLGGSGGGGGGALAKIRIDLKAWRNEAAIDPSALNGATITLTKAGDGSKVAEGTWAGSVVTFSKVPILLNGGTYTLTVSAKEGYSIDANGKQQASITGIAPDMGSDVTYTFNYRTRRYTVAYESNQGAADTVLQDKTVGYGGKSYTSQIDVPGTVAIAAGDLTPLADANGEYSASAAVSGYQITVSYRTCLVTFAPTLSDGDTAITDAQVTGTIGGKAVQRGGTVKIPIGTTGVKIVLNAITGYQTPTVADFDADAASKQIAPQYLTHVYRVQITSNQDAEQALDPAVDRSTVYMLVRYTYNNETVNVGSQLKHGDTFKVPADADTSTIAVSSSSNVTGYNKPVAYSHADGNYAVSLVYSTTKVWVSAASNQGSLPSGLSFTIDGTTVTPNDNTSFVKVPTGDPFTLTASDATHYRKVITNNGNASGASQEVHVQYDTTLVRLNMVGVDNEVEGAAPTGAQGTVTYTDDNSQTISQVLTDNTTPAYVPTGKHFAIAYGAVSGYGTPLDSTDYVAANASMQAQKAAYIYGVLKVEVAMSDQDDADLALVAATVAINGGTPQPMTGTIDTAAHKMVFQATLDAGDGYVVAFSPVSGYQTPAPLNGTFAGGVQTLTADPYLTTIYTLTSIRTTKDGNVQGSNPSGVGCKLSYTGLATPISLTAVNQTAKVPTNLVSSVAITPSTVYGYAASNEGSGQTIQLLYATNAYTLTVSTNQSDAATVLENTVIRVGDEHSGLSQAGYLDFTGARTATEILVPAGTAITAALVSAQSGQPAAASYAESITVDANSKAITVEYQTMRLSVSLAYEGETAPDLTGVTVTVTDTTANTTIAKTGNYWLIPGGHAYKVEVSDDVEGYAAPDAATGTATSVQGASATVTMTYEEAAGFVDLGLPSGLKWAQGNIVKNGSKYEIGAETDYGAYVSWGNIEPHFSANGSTFDDGYNWGSSNSGPYASTPGASIAFTAQGQGFAEDSGYDAARELLGGKWKMPTMADFKELNDNCTSAWVANYNNSGVAGRLFTSKINGATLFFPAAGYGRNSSVSNRGSNGLYWSRSLFTADYGYRLYFNSSNVNPQNYDLRCLGVSVRAVQ